MNFHSFFSGWLKRHKINEMPIQKGKNSKCQIHDWAGPSEEELEKLKYSLDLTFLPFCVSLE